MYSPVEKAFWNAVKFIKIDSLTSLIYDSGREYLFDQYSSFPPSRGRLAVCRPLINIQKHYII